MRQTLSVSLTESFKISLTHINTLSQASCQ